MSNEIKQDSQSSDEQIKASASSIEDKKYVELAIKGDQKAFEKLMEKYNKPLYFHVRKMVKDHNQIEDLVQEAFMKAFNNLESFNTNYAFSTWLYRITSNHTIDYLRKKKLKTFSINNPIKTKDGEMDVELPDETYTTDKNIIKKERKSIIHHAIDELPDKYKQVIEMRHLEEKSYQEISEELDLPLGTVKAHIFRAREMLYKSLKDKRDKF